MLGHLELWILGLLVAVAGLVMLSNYLRVPYPGAKEVAIDAFHHLVYAGATGVAYAVLNR